MQNFLYTIDVGALPPVVILVILVLVLRKNGAIMIQANGPVTVDQSAHVHGSAQV